MDSQDKKGFSNHFAYWEYPKARNHQRKYPRVPRTPAHRPASRTVTRNQ
jgi:hypothetical protein